MLPHRVQFAKNKPDIVVLEIVERGLGGLEDFDFESADKARMEFFR